MAELICIVCPKSCHLRADNDLNVTGHGCERGVSYAQKELQDAVRTLTSTVRINGAALRRCPVKTRSAIPMRHIFEAMRLLDDVQLTAPVTEGLTVVDDICGTGIPWVTTRDM